MFSVPLNENAEKLRLEFRAWLLKTEIPRAASDSSLDAFITQGRAWQQTLAQGRWIGVHWPSAFGGRGLTLVEEALLQEELVRVSAPQVLGLFGLTMVGPVLIEHGTDQQRSRFLAPILEGQEIWCQGFSEPNAGSDLANIRTKAEKVEGGFRITGQKIWTSFAQIADWCFLLARTTTGKKKHDGLTYFLVDMKQAGITTRPLRQITGDEEFNEVFLDGVFVPEENVVGQVDQGWKMALSTLMYERVILTFARQVQSEGALRQLVAHDLSARSAADVSRLADLISTSCAVRALSFRHLEQYSNNTRPGPEGSLDKLFWSETFQKIARCAMDFEGNDALAGEKESEAVFRYLYSRGRTIAAGTSEIQRNIIAERVIGLPRQKIVTDE